MTTEARSEGTRFSVYCQPDFLGPAFEDPVSVSLKPPAGSVTAGPCDDRIRVVDAIGKPIYDTDFPPYRGRCNPPAEPDEHGHFDHLQPDSPQFNAAHAYAGLRFVLDVWESYSGTPVRWFFADDYSHLEVIPNVDWKNGQAGYGFVELGHAFSSQGDQRQFALNFDVLAHEMGHIILASELGMPLNDDVTQYRGFQESASDIIALLSVLHFDHFVDHLLEKTKGNLYIANRLNSLAEVARNEQIRATNHDLTMRDIDFAWTPSRFLNQKQIHRLGKPFTAAIFDVLVENFHEGLVEAGAITRSLDELAESDVEHPPTKLHIEREFAAAYADAPEAFHQALIKARDYTGERIVKSWRRLDVDSLTLWQAATEFLTVDRELSGMKYQNILRDCFRRRHFEP